MVFFGKSCGMRAAYLLWKKPLLQTCAEVKLQVDGDQSQAEAPIGI